MVMHARKTQRLNDGYFDKHQSHPYQNSKYGSSKSYGSSSERYETKFRDSPNGNYRSDSPESQSPRDRDGRYQSKSSYLQKMREKERENRDYKVSRDKYSSDCARSPKDKRNRDSEHRTNNDRNDEKSILHPIKVSQLSSRDRKPMHNNCVDKREERDRVPRVGDWSEHVSSSGKKYYYNCKTEVSQWEKPREWVERERDRFRSRDRDRDRDGDRSYGGSSRSGMRHDKHSNSRGGPNSSNKDSSTGGGGGGRDSATGSGGGMGGGSRHWSSGSSRDDSDAPPSGGGKEPRQGGSGGGGEGARKLPPEESAQSSQDMDISPGDSTPTSETSYPNSTSQPAPDPTVMGPVLLANALPRLISHPIQQQTQQPTQLQHIEQHPVQQLSTSSPQSVTTSVTLSNAPGPPLSGVTTLSAALRLGNATLQQCDGSDKQGGMSMSAGGSVSSAVGVVQRSGSVEGGVSLVHSALSVDTSNHGGATIVEGPPTPTHSETPDCTKVAVSACSPPGTSTSLSSLQTVATSSLQALRPQGPTITPSLANHYRDDLVDHVREWPADALEKQAQMLAEEAHVMGSIHCSKVSADLKSARSLVRLTETQATLQEQRLATLYFISSVIELKWLKFCLTNNVKYCDKLKMLYEDVKCIEESCRVDRILFLRQQIKELEELKSQNSFMSDDS